MKETLNVIEKPDTKQWPYTKKRVSLKEFSVYIILGILLAFAGGFMVRGVARKICYDLMGIDNTLVRVLAGAAITTPRYLEKNITIDWAELYPFSTDEDKLLSSKMVSAGTRIIDILKKIREEISSNAQTKQYFRMTYLELITSIEKHLSLTYIGDVFQLETGNIVESFKKEDVSEFVDGLTDFYDFLQDREIDFLYVQAPNALNSEDDLAKIYNFANQNADDFLLGLDKEAIPYLDLRQSIKEQSLDQHAMFLKTDHHWKPETGLWAAQNIAERLNTFYGCKIDTSIYDTKNYNYLYEAGFLGTSGEKATLGIAEPETFTRIFPKFPVDLTIHIPESGVNKQGNFSVIYWDERWAEWVQENNPYYKNYYGVYTYTPYQLTSFTNHLDTTGKSVLILRDSFSMVMNPFLALGCESVTAIHPEIFNGSIRTWIEQNEPDVVICMVYPNFLYFVKDLI